MTDVINSYSFVGPEPMCKVCGCTPNLAGFSKDESIKAHSRHLRGNISEELIDERAGRWWWEQDEVKECGLHWSNR